MKGRLYFLALWLAVLNGPAVRAQINWGLLAGGSLATFGPHHGSVSSWEYNPGAYSLLVTGRGGVTAEAPVNRHWLLDASLSYDGSGSHAVYGSYNFDGGQTSTLNIRLSYLQLPMEVIYQFNPGHAVRFLVGGGVYAAVGVRGKEKGTTISLEGPGPLETSPIDNNITFTNKASTENAPFYPSAVKPLDAGYTVMAGIQWSHFRVSPGFSQGFVNLFPGDMFKGKNKNFSLSLVYWIHA
jgi:Outer membrane protein beta-barrel domain